MEQSKQLLDDQFPDHPDEKLIPDPLLGLFGVGTPYVFVGFSVLGLFAFDWAGDWAKSGTPFLIFLLLLGPHGQQVRSPVSVWSYFIAVNVVYAFLATSWLAWYFYAAIAWIGVLIVSIAQSDRAQRYMRRNLRYLSRDLHWFQDRVACFRLPALEIDVDVSGLMVVRGLTLCLSSFSVEAHGIEVAIKLAEDQEIAIQTEKVVVRLGRSIEIGDVYANFKTAADTGPGSYPDGHELNRAGTMQQLTDGNAPTKKITANTIQGAIDEFQEVTDVIYPEDEEKEAQEQYDRRIKRIQDTSTINLARKELGANTEIVEKGFTQKEKKAMIASFLHDQTSLPHPPEYSITVSKLKSLTPPWLHRFNERFPIGLRFLLQVIAYLHPVKINGIIAGGSGKFVSSILQDQVFKNYPDANSDIARLATRIETWLETGNFVAQISKINGLAQVPITTIYNITASIKTSTLQVFKVLTAENEIDAEGDEEDKKTLTIRDKAGIQQEQDKGISECMRLGGVSAAFEIPTMLLPHHEYLFPAPPAERNLQQEKWIEPVAADVTTHSFEDDRIEPETLEDDFNGETVDADGDRDKDQVNVDLSLLVSLPAQFNSTLLHFISAMVKASKLIEMEKNATGFDREVKSLSQFSKAVNSSIKESFKKSVVATVASDAWIAKIINRVLGAIEDLKGDLGYKMPIPVPLQPRRELAENYPYKI